MTAIPARIKAVVLERDKHRCVIAGPECTGTATVADHRANRGSGGSTLLNAVTNLIAACERCNGWKEDCTGDAREELVRRGVRVLQAATNAGTLIRARNTPVEYPDGMSMFLLEWSPWLSEGEVGS